MVGLFWTFLSETKARNIVSEKMAKIDPIYFTQLLSEAKKPKQGITKVIFGFECSFGYL